MAREDTFFHYLPVNEETMSWGIYVTGAGRAVIRPGEKYPPSGHPTLYQFDWSRGRTLPEFQLVLITDGAGEFESEATGHVRFEGVALLVVFPGVWHRFRPSAEAGWSERWVSFNLFRASSNICRALFMGLSVMRASSLNSSFKYTLFALRRWSIIW